MGTHRLKSSAGRWAQAGWSHAGKSLPYAPWLSIELVERWEDALEKAASKSAVDALRRGVELSRAMPFSERLCEVIMPLSDAQREKADADLASKRAEFMKPSGWGMRRSEADWLNYERHQRARCEYDASTRRQVKYIGVPDVRWLPTEGNATLFEAGVALDALAAAKNAVELRKILPKARRQAAAILGQEEPEWMAARYDRHGLAVTELDGGQALAFDAASEFDEKPAIAIYVDNGRGSKGFLDKAGCIKNDLAEACLFPSKKKAMAFANSKRAGACHAVSVVATAVSYEPLVGNPTPAEDLASVIASRERRELERVLAGAHMQDLLEELERRKQDGVGAAKEASELAAKRRSRL